MSTLPAIVGRPSRALEYYRDLVLVLVRKELAVRYKNTLLGYGWSVMHPLALALVFSLVFRVVLRLEIAAYPLYLIAGLFPWQWIANVANSANFYFLANSSLIKKVRFPRASLVLAGVLNESFHFVASVPVIVGFMVYFGRSPSVHWLWAAPLLLAVQLLLTVGIGLVIATCNLFFRDLERLVTLATHLLFYLTPVVYQADQVPSEYRWILFANPLAAMVMCWQGLFYGGQVPVLYLGVALSWACALAAVGCLVYGRSAWRFAEVV